ncbi:MAG: triose-phosphate isomerase [Candidatus Marinimicrobia bacterium]|nr:triose-phosphate isomerase [Candidatus Neomarinimicrobiota bacterium]|tara:strand:- start:908 stop:1657 length:750 start_codon:yes stop_codon:yes gene_type:complete
MNKYNIYIANWKMNLNAEEANQYISDFISIYKPDCNKEIVFCPSFTNLPIISNKVNGLERISFGAQNINENDCGSYTGEISASMIKQLCCKYGIVGHSERRKYFKETDQIINKKIKQLIYNNIIPVLCVGENYRHRELGISNDVVEKQMFDCLKGIATKSKNKILIAYEPVWAIGSGQSAEVKDISSMNSVIRNCMITLGFNIEQFYILYGGSVDIDNVINLKSSDYLSGFLIGGASLNVQKFWNLIKK